MTISAIWRVNISADVGPATRSDQRIMGSGGATHPFWSPDSKRLAFFQAGALKAVTLSDGSITEIARVPDRPAGGAWSADGRIIFARGGQLVSVRVTGGEPAILKQVQPDGPYTLRLKNYLLAALAKAEGSE